MMKMGFTLITLMLVSLLVGTNGGIPLILQDGEENQPYHHQNLRSVSSSSSSSLSLSSSNPAATHQNEEYPPRRALGDDKEEEVKNDKEEKEEDDDEKEERVIVRCKGDEDLCLRQLMSTGGRPFDIVHLLKGTEFFALKIKKSQEQDIQSLSEIDEIENDPIRRPFYPTTTTSTSTSTTTRIGAHHGSSTSNTTTSYRNNHNEEEQQQLRRSRRRRQLKKGQIIPYGIDLVKAREVWETYGITGQNVKVCVMDTGLEFHEDLNLNPRRNVDGWTNKFKLNWDNDGYGHGTHVTGIIAATDNDIGVVGVAPDVDVYIVRVFDKDGDWYASDIEAAAQACQEGGAHIINMSLGGYWPSKSEEAIFKKLHEQGVLSVAASGNEAEEKDNPVNYPAGYETVMSVGSVDAKKVIASSSTYNEFVNIVAPGVKVESLDYDGKGLVTHSGTSMSTPHAVGVAALLKSYQPSLTPDEIITVMEETAEDLGRNGRDDRYGWGLINALAAMDRLSARTSSSPPSEGPGDDGLYLATSAACVTVNFTMITDPYAQTENTRYQLLNMSDDTVIWSNSSLSNNQAYAEVACLKQQESCYMLYAFDGWGDGVGNDDDTDKESSVTLTVDGETVYTGGNFGSSLAVPIGNDCGSCIPLELRLISDSWADNEASGFFLQEKSSGDILWDVKNMVSGEPYHRDACLDPNKCYSFVILDLYNDGIGAPMTLTYGGVALEGDTRFITLGRGCMNT